MTIAQEMMTMMTPRKVQEETLSLPHQAVEEVAVDKPFVVILR